MSDDIVTHLRAVAADFVYRADISVSKLDEAADEIQRLRKEVERWRELADRMYVELVKDWCWHCGHEKTRNCYVDSVVEDYRHLSINSGVNDGV